MNDASQQVVRRDSFHFTQPALLWGRLLLFEDRLELRGWSLRGRYRNVVALRDVEHVDVHPCGDEHADDEVGLWCSGGGLLRLHLRDAIGWKQCVLRQQSRLANPNREPPEGRRATRRSGSHRTRPSSG